MLYDVGEDAQVEGAVVGGQAPAVEHLGSFQAGDLAPLDGFDSFRRDVEAGKRRSHRPSRKLCQQRSVTASHLDHPHRSQAGTRAKLLDVLRLGARAEVTPASQLAAVLTRAAVRSVVEVRESSSSGH